MSTKTNSILIAFPVDHASLILVDKLRTDKENLITLYLDDNLKTRLMTHVLEDLQTLAGNDIIKTSSQDWRDFDYVVFPNLNLAPSQTDKAFGATMKNMFKKHLEGVQFKEGAVVFFGQNFRGIIAARELTEVHPHMKESVLVFSSIHAASIIAYGKDGGRHVPNKEGSFFTTGSRLAEDAKVDQMLGKWSFGQFCLAEATALFIGIVQCIENEGMMEDIELVGKHPNAVEANTYDITRDLPVFMSVSENQNTSDEYTRYLEASNAYFLGNYKSD